MLGDIIALFYGCILKRGREDASGTIEDAAVKWDVVQAVYAIITQVVRKLTIVINFVVITRVANSQMYYSTQ